MSWFLAQTGTGLGAGLVSFGLLGGEFAVDAIFNPLAKICVEASVQTSHSSTSVQDLLLRSRLLSAPLLQSRLICDASVTVSCEATQRSISMDACVCGVEVSCDVSAPELRTFVSPDSYYVRTIQSGGLTIVSDVAAPVLDTYESISCPSMTTSVDKSGNC